MDDFAGRLDVHALAQCVVTASAHRNPLIGIDGPGASGKSTLADLLAKELGPCSIVHVDDFYLPSEDRRNLPADGGSSFDLPRLVSQVLDPLTASRPARYQKYDWDSDTLSGWEDVPAGVPVIVEGVYSLHTAARDSYTWSIFCTASRELRLMRGLERDGEEARSSWVDEWMPTEDAYVSAEQPDDFANLVVSSEATGVDGTSYSIVSKG